MTKFWGTEVKPGQIVSCDAGNESVIRISQVALGETKQRREDVVLFVKVVDSKFVIGTLRAKSHPHMTCDLIFDGEFELSHSSETASVFFCGYKRFESDSAEEHGGKKDECRDDDFPSSDDMELWTHEDDSISSTDNLTIPPYIEEDIPEDISSTYEDMSSSQTSEHEETSNKIGKKAAEIGLKSASVKANVAPSGQKSGGKAGSRVAAPYQSQKSSKKASENSKLKGKLSKSTGDHVCEPCSRTFVSDKALQAHRNAKHTAAE